MEAEFLDVKESTPLLAVAPTRTSAAYKSVNEPPVHKEPMSVMVTPRYRHSRAARLAGLHGVSSRRIAVRARLFQRSYWDACAFNNLAVYHLHQRPSSCVGGMVGLKYRERSRPGMRRSSASWLHPFLLLGRRLRAASYSSQRYSWAGCTSGRPWRSALPRRPSAWVCLLR